MLLPSVMHLSCITEKEPSCLPSHKTVQAYTVHNYLYLSTHVTLDSSDEWRVNKFPKHTRSFKETVSLHKGEGKILISDWGALFHGLPLSLGGNIEID